MAVHDGKGRPEAQVIAGGPVISATMPSTGTGSPRLEAHPERPSPNGRRCRRRLLRLRGNGPGSPPRPRHRLLRGRARAAGRPVERPVPLHRLRRAGPRVVGAAPRGGLRLARLRRRRAGGGRPSQPRPAGFGHSCGAAALLLAEQARPGRFSSLYCFEPIVLPDDSPLPPTLDGNPLAAGALRRHAGSPRARRPGRTSRPRRPSTGSTPSPGGVRRHGFGPVPAVSSSGAVARTRPRCTPTASPTTPSPGWSGPVPGDTGLRRRDRRHRSRLPELLAARLPGERVEVFNGLEHFGPLEDPGRWPDPWPRPCHPNRHTPGVISRRWPSRSPAPFHRRK